MELGTRVIASHILGKRAAETNVHASQSSREKAGKRRCITKEPQCGKSNDEAEWDRRQGFYNLHMTPGSGCLHRRSHRRYPPRMTKALLLSSFGTEA